MTHAEYADRHAVLTDRIEWQTRTMHTIAKRLSTTTYAHPNDQLNDGIKLGTCATTAKNAMRQLAELNARYRKEK